MSYAAPDLSAFEAANAVTVSVPCFGTNRYIRRAVEGLLAQTHRPLTVVVVNDGDPDPPWRELADIRDPRLVRFSLAENHGPYFAHQVVFAASTTPWFLVHDADDWSAPDRIAKLLQALIADGSDLAFSAWQQYREGPDGVTRKDCIRWRHRTPGEPRYSPTDPQEPFLFDPLLTDEFINRATHHGLFRRRALADIGGCYGGFRMNYDTLLTNFMLMTGRVSFLPEPLYHYLHRPTSLSHHAATGAHSPARREARTKQAALYAEALRDYRSWTEGRLTSAALAASIRRLAHRSIPAADQTTLHSETTRLAAQLCS